MNEIKLELEDWEALLKQGKQMLKKALIDVQQFTSLIELSEKNIEILSGNITV